MAVKIRLRRTGAKNSAHYRVVAAETSAPRDGRFIEVLGWYDPNREGRNFKIDVERIAEWTSNGAQLSDTVRSLLKKARQAPTEQADAHSDAPPDAAPAEAEAAPVEVAATEASEADAPSGDAAEVEKDNA